MSKKATLDDKKDWLVKHEEEIRGPYLITELMAQLRERSIYSLDEVRRSDQRWQMIRDHKDFFVFLQALRFEEETLEKTALIGGNSTKTLKSDLTPPPPLLQKTSEEIFKSIPPPEISTELPPEPEMLKDVEPIPQGPQKPSHLTGKAFGVQNDLRLQKEIELKRRSPWLTMVAGVGFLVLAFVGFRFWSIQKREEEIDRWAKAAQRYKNIQLYNKSAEALRKLSGLIKSESDWVESLGSNSLGDLALIQITQLGETTRGRRILERQMQNSGRSSDERYRDFVLVGLSYLIEGNLKEALYYFDSALSASPSGWAAKINLSWVSFSQKDYRQAFENLRSVDEKLSPMVSLARGLIVLTIPKDELPSEAREVALQSLRWSLKNSKNLEFDLKWLETRLALRSGENFDGEARVRALLDSHLEGRTQFVKDPLVSDKWLEPNFWVSYCDEIQKEIPDESRKFGLILNSICLLNLGRISEAGGILSEMIKAQPKDALVGLAEARWLAAQGLWSQVALVGKREGMPVHAIFELAEAMLGRSPSQEGKNYTGMSWMQSRIATLNGLWTAGQKGQAQEKLRVLLAEEPSYVPALELRELWERSP